MSYNLYFIDSPKKQQIILIKIRLLTIMFQLTGEKENWINEIISSESVMFKKNKHTSAQEMSCFTRKVCFEKKRLKLFSTNQEEQFNIFILGLYMAPFFAKKFFSHFFAKEFFAKNRGAKNEKKIILENGIFQAFNSWNMQFLDI